MSRSAAKRETTPSSLFGRDRELSLLGEMMGKGGPRVVHIHGVSGIGKSSLIRAFTEVERNRKRTVHLLDGRDFEPTERGFLHELARSMRIERPTRPKVSRTFSAMAKPVVIILDSYELLGLLDAWRRQSFMVGLKENVRLILVSRFSPASQWSEAPEWRGKFRSIQLQPISEPAALELLAKSRDRSVERPRACQVRTWPSAGSCYRWSCGDAVANGGRPYTACSDKHSGSKISGGSRRFATT